MVIGEYPPLSASDIMAISTYPRHIESRREWDPSGMEFSSEYYPQDDGF